MGGCCFAISGSLAFGKCGTKAEKITIDDISLVHTDPRRIIVCIHAACFQAVCIGLHAPDSPKDVAVPGSVRKWWVDTIAIAKRCTAPGDNIICCVDGNLRITRAAHGVTGMNIDNAAHGGTDQENLIEFALSLGLCIVNTVDDFLADKHCNGTYVVASEPFPIRSDFVLLSDTSGIVAESVAVWHEMSLHAAAPDHIPITARAKFTTCSRVAVTKRRVVRYDRQAVTAAKSLPDPRSCPAVLALEDAILRSPVVPTCVDPSSHEHVMAGYFEGCLVDAFPRPQRPAKQKYMSVSTDSIVRLKGIALAKFHAAGRKIKQASVWFVFRVWVSWLPKRAMWCPTWRPARGPVTPQLGQLRADLGTKWEALHVKASLAISADFAKLLAKKAGDLVNATLVGNQHQIYKLLRSMKPWVANTAYRLCGIDGEPAATYTGERRHIRTYFEGKTTGATCSMQSLIDDERAAAGLQAIAHDGVVRVRAAIPSIVAVTRLHAHAKCLNGVGEDLIGGELHALLPAATAQAMHPLQAKVVYSIRRPLIWNGGQLMTLWKGKGCKSKLTNSRDITLCVVNGKVAGKVSRKRLTGPMQKMSVETQLGSGMNGGACDTAHLSSTSPFAYSMLRNRKVFQLYVDVVAAFASLCRRIALPHDLESEELWRRHLANCGFSNDDVQNIVEMACTVIKWCDGRCHRARLGYVACGA